jgi:NAD(P)H-dependent flavin oxidoreductase YrpB (nitropropane dioxygenase family)
MHTVGSAADAKRAAGCGVDIVVAQGWEAGGHVRGTMATMPLIPAVVDAVFSDACRCCWRRSGWARPCRSFGARRLRCLDRTGFLGSHEATIHPRYRERLLRANENDTVYAENLFDVRWANAPHRVLRNQTVEVWEAAGRPPSGKRPGEGEVIATSRTSGPIVRYQSYTPGSDA